MSWDACMNAPLIILWRWMFRQSLTYMRFYAALEQGEKLGVWDFEEGDYFHLLKS